MGEPGIGGHAPEGGCDMLILMRRLWRRAETAAPVDPAPGFDVDLTDCPSHPDTPVPYIDVELTDRVRRWNVLDPRIERPDGAGCVARINGVDVFIPTDTGSATAIEILQHADRLGVIPGKPENYTLDGDNRYADEDVVDLQVDSTFITLRNAPTPVAMRGMICSSS